MSSRGCIAILVAGSVLVAVLFQPIAATTTGAITPQVTLPLAYNRSIPPSVTLIPLGSLSSGAFAVNSTTNRIYATNSLDGTVSIIDGNTLGVTTFPVGNKPNAIAIDEATNKIYITNENSNTISIVDGVTNGVSTLLVENVPSALAVNPVTNKIYVANGGDVSVVDGVSNAIAIVPLGAGITGFAVDAQRNKIYVADGYNYGYVSIIDGVTNAVTTVSIADQPRLIAVNTTTNKIYVISPTGNVSVVDGASHVVSILNVGLLDPRFLAVNPVTNRIDVVVNPDIVEINGSTNALTHVTVTNTFGAFGVYMSGILESPNSNQIYATTNVDKQLVVVDGVTNVVRNIPTENYLYSLAVNAQNGVVYASTTYLDNSTQTYRGAIVAFAGL